MSERIAGGLLLALATCGPASDAALPGRDARDPEVLRVLVLSGGGFHAFEQNTDILLAGLEARGKYSWTRVRGGEGQEAPEVERVLTSDLAGRFDVVLAYTQGDWALSSQARRGLLDFVQVGGGFVGLHSAADSHPDWDEYEAMLGGRFLSHPPLDLIGIVHAAKHPVLHDIGETWAARDEFYELRRTPVDGEVVLLMGATRSEGRPRPVAWVRPWGEGRVAYTLLGHAAVTHGDFRFHRLVSNMLRWTADRDPAASAAGGGAR